MTKKEFALKAIAPYVKDRFICGYDADEKQCQYLTKEGKKCVLGSFMINPAKWYASENISLIFSEGQAKVLRPEAVDILSVEEWKNLQLIHDGLATSINTTDSYIVRDYVVNLNLFTFEEMIEYANQ